MYIAIESVTPVLICIYEAFIKNEFVFSFKFMYIRRTEFTLFPSAIVIAKRFKTY